VAEELRLPERRARILELLDQQGQVRVTELVSALGVTDTSIRRDLDILEGEGQLRRVHGGAVPLPQDFRAERYGEMLHLHLAEKRRIGAAAASMISPGDVLILDSGTTSLQVAVNIPAPLRTGGMLTIVTNSLPLAEETRAWPSPNLLLLGGFYMPDYQATAGPQALEQLSQITADKAFLGADGITLADGITTSHVLMADLDRMMVERARQVILTVDSSKLGRAGLVHVAGIRQIHVVITDRKAPPEVVEGLRAEGVTVQLV